MSLTADFHSVKVYSYIVVIKEIVVNFSTYHQCCRFSKYYSSTLLRFNESIFTVSHEISRFKLILEMLVIVSLFYLKNKYVIFLFLVFSVLLTLLNVF